jgi:hypothetical protein
MMAAVALRLGENVHFDRLLAAVRLRHRASVAFNTAVTSTSSASLRVIVLPSRPFA